MKYKKYTYIESLQWLAKNMEYNFINKKKYYYEANRRGQ